MDPKVTEAVSANLINYASKPQSLLDFTEARPNHPPDDSLIPTEEYTTRLELIREIRDHQIGIERKLKITKLQFCYLIRMPISDLWSTVKQCRFEPLLVTEDFESLVDLTHICE